MKNFLKRAWAEIHLDRLEHNINEIKKLTEGTDIRIMGVVKANAYGHDDENIVPFLEKLGISFFAVSNIKEAEKIRRCGCDADILILGYTPPEYADELSANNIIQTAVTEEHAAALSAAATRPLRVHAAVDTGMGRIGLIPDDIPACADAFERISKLPNIKLEGAFTHYAAADSTDPEDVGYTDMQTEKFFALGNELEKRGLKLAFHCLNSAGGTLRTDKRSAFARFGIMLYGLYPDRGLELPVKLEPVMDLKASVSCVRTLKAGSYVSYGRTYLAEKDISAATIPIGYADGMPRMLSNKAYVTINGRQAPIIGRICMDQLMADVSDIPGVTAGSEVLIFGKNGAAADDIAEMCGTIGYEIVCGISKRIPRVIMYNGEITDVAEYY